MAAEAVPLDCQQGKGTVTGYDSHTAVAAQACAERRYGRIPCYAKADDKGAGRSGGDSPTARRGAAKAASAACRNKRSVQGQGAKGIGAEDSADGENHRRKAGRNPDDITRRRLPRCRGFYRRFQRSDRDCRAIPP